MLLNSSYVVLQHCNKLTFTREWNMQSMAYYEVCFMMKENY